MYVNLGHIITRDKGRHGMKESLRRDATLTQICMQNLQHLFFFDRESVKLVKNHAEHNNGDICSV